MVCKVNYYKWSEGHGRPTRISRDIALATFGRKMVDRLRRMACKTGTAHGGHGGDRWALIVRKEGVPLDGLGLSPGSRYMVEKAKKDANGKIWRLLREMEMDGKAPTGDGCIIAPGEVEVGCWPWQTAKEFFERAVKNGKLTVRGKTFEGARSINRFEVGFGGSMGASESSPEHSIDDHKKAAKYWAAKAEFWKAIHEQETRPRWRERAYGSYNNASLLADDHRRYIKKSGGLEPPIMTKTELQQFDPEWERMMAKEDGFKV